MAKLDNKYKAPVIKSWNYENLPNDIITARLLADGTLLLNGYGMVPNSNHAPWSEYSNLIVRVATLWGITKIEESAFLDYKNLREVELSNSVRVIGSFAFANTLNLRYVDMPMYLESIETKAFMDSGIEVVDLPETLINISRSAFQNCRYLRKVTFHKNCKLKTINSDTFDNCPALHKLTLHKNLEVIDSRAFSRCPLLKQVTFGKKMTHINSFAFNKSGIEEVSFLDNPNKININDNAFNRCDIKNVHIAPKNIFELNIDSTRLSPYKGAFKYTTWLQSLPVQEPDYQILHVFDYINPPRLVLRMNNICYLLKNYHSKNKFTYFRFNEKEYKYLLEINDYHVKAERYFREFNSVLNDNRSFYNTIRNIYYDLLDLVVRCVESKHNKKLSNQLDLAMQKLRRLKETE